MQMTVRALLPSLPTETIRRPVASVQRAEVQKILNTPDLLGLSGAKIRTMFDSRPQDEPRTPRKRIIERDKPNKVSSPSH